MRSLEQQQAAVDAAIAQFPAIFGLRAYGGRFRIDRKASFVNRAGEVQLSVALAEGGEHFARATVAELRREIRPVAHVPHTTFVQPGWPHYPRRWTAGCDCGWKGTDRAAYAQAAADATDHHRVSAPAMASATPPPWAVAEDEQG